MSEKNVENLKEISTEALIEELCSREGIEKVSVGPYKEYEVRKKYQQGSGRDAFEGAAILLKTYESFLNWRFNIENFCKVIPQELKNLDQWVCHQYPQSKNPLCVYPNNDGILGIASVKDRSTWASFNDALTAVRSYGATGIGIQLSNGICGVDIDHCCDNGKLTGFARDIVEILKSYTEISPSGTGIHIFCKGSLSAIELRRKFERRLEVYDCNRYFIVTGNPYLDPDGQIYPLRDCTEELEYIRNEMPYLKRNSDISF